MTRAPTILLVEDESRWQQRVTEILAMFEVIVCHSRREALSLLQRDLRVDAIIVDLKLGLDPDAGKELLADLIAIRPNTPKAILTAYKQKGSMRQAMDEYGVDDIIYKGRIGPDLLRAVNRLVHSHEPGGIRAEDRQIEELAAHALGRLSVRLSQLQSARMRADVQGLARALDEVDRQIIDTDSRIQEVERLHRDRRELLVAEKTGEERIRLVLEFASAMEKLLSVTPP